MDREREEVNTLAAEANKVVADCGRYLEAAEELVIGIPERRAVLEERIAAAIGLVEYAEAEGETTAPTEVYATIRASSRVHNHPAPLHVVMTTTLGAGSRMFSEVASADSCAVLHPSFGE